MTYLPAGLHNASNALAAVSCDSFGMKPERIAVDSRNSLRWEDRGSSRKRENDIDDCYNSNPDALKAALRYSELRQSANSGSIPI